jgi:hypothetical protein
MRLKSLHNFVIQYTTKGANQCTQYWSARENAWKKQCAHGTGVSQVNTGVSRIARFINIYSNSARSSTHFAILLVRDQSGYFYHRDGQSLESAPQNITFLSSHCNNLSVTLYISRWLTFRVRSAACYWLRDLSVTSYYVSYHLHQSEKDRDRRDLNTRALRHTVSSHTP